MISLDVKAFSGHYKVPGRVPNLLTANTFPTAPVSCVVGMLESFAGQERGSFQVSGSRVAIGRTKKPWGRGEILQQMTTFRNLPGGKGLGTGSAPIRKEILFDLGYRFVVEGDFESCLRLALQGEVQRYGTLYLGRSDDVVTWIDEAEPEAEWLVPGQRFHLPVKTHGFDFQKVLPVYSGFTFSVPATDIPAEAWIDLNNYPEPT